MCVSGAIDILREKQCSSGKVSSTKIHIFVDVMYNISDQRTSNLPVYIQLLPNIGISLTRLFGILAIYEFTYFTAPRSAQALFMTFCLFSITISDILPDTLPNLKFDVSSKQNILFFIQYYSNHFSVSLRKKSVMETDKFFLYSCCCSVNFDYRFSCFSEIVSNVAATSPINTQTPVLSSVIYHMD